MEYDQSDVPVDVEYVEPISHQPGNNEKEHSFTEDAPTNSKTNVPKLDMEFDTEEEAYDFYNAYAASVGFSIRRTGKKGNPIVYRKFCCSAQGTKQPDKRDPYYKTHRPETRTNCGACMTINSRYTHKFKVTEFVSDHNGHELVSPRKSHMLRSHRRITAQQATEIDNLNKSGIAAKASLTFVSQKEGGREKVGYLLQDLKNYLRSKRTIQMPDGDVGGLLNYMQSKQSQDPNFFNAMQVDEDDQITNIFWVDGQMMSDYVYFGDVVSFDTTYRKNKEDRPFGIFVGVNHHRQTVVFGAAFLYNETAETFNWLFSTFEEAMNGKKPETIFTDDNPAMAKALGEVWHGTCHRLCIWHIYQNAAKHLGDVFGKFPEYVDVFKCCIYGHEYEEDFLKAWDDMLVKYDLQDNEWLMRLFSKKEKWALVYGRQHFCADILSTQRSESMNSVLKRYVSHKSNLLQFFEQFDRLVEDRRYKELEEDTKNNQSRIHLPNDFEILKHAREVYTQKTFTKFQAELSHSYDAKKKKILESGTIYRYEVTPLNSKYHRVVTYDASDNTIVCSCKKFEFAGILCLHALKIFAEHEVMMIPDLYIKRRWTKSAKKGYIEGIPQRAGTSNVSPDNRNEAEEKLRHGEHYRELCRLFSQLTTRASRADDTFEFAKAAGYKALHEVDTMFDKKQITKPIVATSHVVKNALVSRVSKEKSVASVEAGGSIDNGVAIDEDCLPEAETIIWGLKKKQTSKVKSGKRLKSGLEEAIKKRQPRNNKKSSLGKVPDPKPVESIIHNVSGVTSGSTTVLPFSQVSQNNEVVHPYWGSPPFTWGAPYFPNELGVSHLSRPQLVNNTPQRLNYFPQTNYHLNTTSMSNLQQAQMLQEQEIGRCPMKGSTSNTRHLARNEDDGA